MLKNVLVKEYMTVSLVTFTPDMDVLDAMKLLLQHRISGAPVVDLRGNMVGLLSEVDCLKVSLNAAYHDDWGGKVSDYMSQQVATIDAHASIVEVAELFVKGRFRRFPVLKDNRLIGQISRRDVLKAMMSICKP